MPSIPSPAPDAAAFAKGLGKDVHPGEQRALHRRLRKPYKKRVRMPSILDPHVEDIERWLAAAPRLTALAILSRLAQRRPSQFGPPQHSTVQRLLKALRRKTAGQLIAARSRSASPPSKKTNARQDQAGQSGTGDWTWDIYGAKQPVGLTVDTIASPPSARP